MRIVLILTLVPIAVVCILLGIYVWTPDMQYEIGHAYTEGTWLPKNHEAGLPFLERAADGGKVEAQSELGREYLLGNPKQDLSKAIKYLSLAESKEDSASTYLLAYAHETGLGVSQDYSKAISLYEKALKLDPMASQRAELAFSLLTLPKPYADYKKAYDMALESTREAAPSPIPQWCLGMTCEYGLGTDKNLSKAEEWYKKAAALGDGDSQYELALLTLRNSRTREASSIGKGPGPAFQQAELCLDAPSRMQQIDAQLLLALMKCMDAKVPSSDKSFQELLETLSSRGFPAYAERLKALCNLRQRSPGSIESEAHRATAYGASNH